MKLTMKNYFSFFKGSSYFISLRTFFVLVISSSCFSLHAADRFAAPVLNIAANEFNNRFTASSFNTDFLLSHVLNNARQVERLGENVKKNTKFITEQTNSLDGAISNSVIVPAGTDADTIIIVNINEGDSFAIQR